MTWPINSRPEDEVTLDVPTEILCSYHYFSEVDMGAIRRWGTRIIGDSGAFSAMSLGKPIDRERFHQWASTWADDLFWVASLDVIGDVQGTRRNWQAAQEDGLKLVPTLHYGESTQALAWYVEQGVDFLGLGGMVPYSSEPARLMRWLIPMFKWARDNAPHVRFHGWGISHPRLVDTLPWWSTDSSGFSSVFRFGTLRLWLPQSGRFVSVSMDGYSVRKYARTLKRFYGVSNWRTVAVSKPANRREVGRVAYKALQLYSEWLRARQRVTPPASLAPRMGAWAGADQGPLQVAAINQNDLAFQPGGGAKISEGPLGATPTAASAGDAGEGASLHPEASGTVGPRSVAASGRAGSAQIESIHPNFGPSPFGATGSPDCQVVKAIDPQDAGASRLTTDK